MADLCGVGLEYPMLRRTRITTIVTAVLATTLILTTACGGGVGGSSADRHVDRPVVRSFSPFLSPIDFGNLQQNPTFSNNALTSSTDPRFPGEIVITFQESTVIDFGTVFLGGSPALGVDPSALQITQEIPGVGNITIPVEVLSASAPFTDPATGLPVTPTEPLDHVIRCQPLPPFASAGAGNNGTGFVTNMPDGQYTIGVFKNIRNTESKEMVRGPVFHSFFVGANDTIRPRVLSTNPVNGEQNVGAGAPPPAAPPGVEGIADVTTNVFGPTSPDITIRFTEGITATTVNANNITVVDAGAFVPGGGAPPQLAPAPGFPKLKSDNDRETLPSNGHEIIWRVDPTTGGFPFGTQIQVTVIGEDPDTNGNPTNQAPIADLAGNKMELSDSFQFQTVAPPDLPNCPFPEYAIWWSASDRVGVIDSVNQQGLADQFTGAQQFPLGVPENVLPPFNDTIATAANIPNFSPGEILIDTRTAFQTHHSWAYVQSAESGQIAIVHTKNMIPVALINTPTPGGIATQTANQGAKVLLVTNSSANTITAFSLANITPGVQFLNGPIFITKVTPTGNTPAGVAISAPPAPALIPDHWNRDGPFSGPGNEVIMYVDKTDGVVNTTTLASDEPVKQFALGVGSAPNDISMSPCFGGPVVMFAAISQGGLSGQGKVAYYIAGPGCTTGASTPQRPDSIVGDLTGFDGPAGLDNLFVPFNSAFWAVAESGTDSISTLGFVTGTFNIPDIISRFDNVGNNPTSIAHRPSYFPPCIAIAGSTGCLGPLPLGYQYKGTQQLVNQRGLNGTDTTFDPSTDLYVCARGEGKVTVIDQVSGALSFYSPIPIPGIRQVASTASQ